MVDEQFCRDQICIKQFCRKQFSRGKFGRDNFTAENFVEDTLVGDNFGRGNIVGDNFYTNTYLHKGAFTKRLVCRKSSTKVRPARCHYASPYAASFIQLYSILRRKKVYRKCVRGGKSQNFKV